MVISPSILVHVEKAYLSDIRLSNKVRDFLREANSGGPALETLSVKEAREAFVNAQNATEVDISGIDVSEITIMANGCEILLHIIKPTGVVEKLPIFMFIHGGGWVLGDFHSYKRMVRDLVVLSGQACVFVNYSRSPESPYPTAIKEIYATLQWLAEHDSEINVDAKRLAIVGNSAGGNMAIAICLMAKENKGPEIKLQILMWPTVDVDFSTDSYKQFGEDRFLTTSVIKWMYGMYLPDWSDRKDVYASPLLASIEQLRGLPPTLIQLAENDVLRDEGQAFGRKLDEAGVEVSTVRYNGMIHDFAMLNALEALPETRSALLQVASELKKHLS